MENNKTNIHLFQYIELSPIIEFINKEFTVDNKVYSSNNLNKLVSFLNDEEIVLNLENAIELLYRSNILKETIETVINNKQDVITNNETLENLFLAYDLLNSKTKEIDSTYENSYYSRNKSKDIDLLKLYLTTMPPMLSIEDEKKYSVLASMGNTEAKNKLVEHNLRLVVSIAKRYSKSSNVSLSDLIQEGNVGLVKAAERYDHTKSCRFSTYAAWWIRQTVRLLAYDNSRLIKLPTLKQEMIVKLNTVRNELTDTLNRKPTNKELALALDISIDKVIELESLSDMTVSLSSPVKNDSDDGSELGEFIEDKSSNFEDDLINERFYNEFIELIMKSDIIDQRSKEVLMLRYGVGYDKHYSLEEIGKMYGVTRERIRQIEIKALRKLSKDIKIKNYVNTEYSINDYNINNDCKKRYVQKYFLKYNKR